VGQHTRYLLVSWCYPQLWLQNIVMLIL